MTEVIPVIIVKTEKEFRERLAQMESLVSWMQIDVVDGKFAPNVTWGDPKVVASCETSMKFEIDLMVQNVEEAVGKWLEAVPQVERIYFHQEALGNDPNRSAEEEGVDLLVAIKEAGIEAGMALNPGTPIETLSPFIKYLDAALLLGVSPGFGGQELKSDVIKKVEALRGKYPDLPIEIDGGVSADTARQLVHAGATRLASGTFIFNHPAGSEGGLEELRNAIR